MSTKRATAKFTRNPVQADLIRKCAVRAASLYEKAGQTCCKLRIEMDLSAANANGCPMDFTKLLGFPDASFMHDVGGIQDHINRTNGRLTASFLPRCAIGQTS
jgi:hypothetical protein